MDIKKIYEEYFTTVYRFARKLSGNPELAEELTQETFFKAMRNLESFHGQCEIRVWLCQICKNQYFSLVRKKKWITDLPDTDWDMLPAEDDLTRRLENCETSKQIHRILHHMTEPYKEVFTLRVFGELPFKEIANLFGKSESWARVIFHRATNKIRKEINNEDNL